MHGIYGKKVILDNLELTGFIKKIKGIAIMAIPFFDDYLHLLDMCFARIVLIASSLIGNTSFGKTLHKMVA